MARGNIRDRSGPKGPAFEVRVFVGKDATTGKYRYQTQTVRGTRRDAERVLTKLLGEVDQGGHLGPTTATLGSLLGEWQKLKAPGWSTKTAIETRGYVDRWIAPAEDSDRYHWTPGRLLLRDVTTAVLDAWQRRLLDHLAPATVRRIHGVTHSAIEQAVTWDWLMRNPASRCEPITGRSAEIVPPSAADVRRLLDHLVDDRPTMFLMVWLAAVTGRRRGELCALRWTDVDFEAGTLRVARTLTQSDDGWVEVPISKNRKRFPALAIGPATVDLLEAHRLRQVEMVEALGQRPKRGDFVFLTLGRSSETLGPWSPFGVTREFTRTREALDMSGIRFHDLRHYVATTLIDEGVSMTSIAGRLGHGGGGRVTQEVYGHLAPETDRQGALTLEQKVARD